MAAKGQKKKRDGGAEEMRRRGTRRVVATCPMAHNHTYAVTENGAGLLNHLRMAHGG